MIDAITRQQIGVVERASQVFLKLRLVELLDSGACYIANILLLIGQLSTEGRKRKSVCVCNARRFSHPAGRTFVRQR